MSAANETARLVRRFDRVGLATFVAIVALAFASAGCAGLIQRSSGAGPTVCSDKVVQSITTNKAVSGLWACLSPAFQTKLESYVAAGLLHSDDDSVFVDPTIKGTLPITSHLVGLSNGIAMYVILVQSQTAGLVTLSMSLWLNPAPKVNNFAITSPAL